VAFDITTGSGKTISADVFGTAHNISSGEQTQFVALAGGTLGALALALETNPAFVAGELVSTPSANFNRPADTTAYASADLVANTVTAGSVTPLSWTAPRYATGSGHVRRVRFKKSQTTTTNAIFRLHLYTSSPTCANGDNGAWSTNHSGYLGSFEIDITASTGRTFTDSTWGPGTPSVGTEVGFDIASGSTVYGLIEARGAYTPASAETFTVELEIVQK
jgi:hypothetical protein